MNSKKAIEKLKKNKTFYLLFNKLGVIHFPKRNLNFEALLKIIINQQLSNKTSNLIFSRLKKTLNNNLNLTPLDIHSIEEYKLKSAGISYSKIKTMKRLSNTFIKNPQIINEWNKLDDDSARFEIERNFGFGPWSSNIILLFYLGRKDIFPYNDSTLKKAYLKLYNQDIDNDLSLVNWAKPYRSLLALYLWRWVDNGMRPVN